jgi:hypothetical protein
MSPKACSTVYSPGRQATDDLRISKLNVGQKYYYSIRASSRTSFRSSNPTIVEHKIMWQASIDGKVSLSEASGGLPISGVMVLYRLKALNGTILSVCPMNTMSADWW